MKRREFVGLGAAALALRPVPQAAGWRFTLDGEARWSLVGRAGRTAIGGGAIAVELAGQPPVALADLEGRRRLRSARRNSDVAVVIGQTGGVEVTAEFDDGPPATITVRLRGLDQVRDLVGVRFGDVRAPWTAAWADGYRGTDACTTGVDVAATGHGRIALRGGGAPDLALAFGADDAGDGTFTVGDGRLVIASRTRHRALSADEGPASFALTLLPGEPPLTALARLAAEDAPTLPATAPALWRYAAGAAASEDDLLAALDVLKTRAEPADCHIVLVGDGYQQAIGAWDTGPAFPHGHASLAERIRAAGFQPGLWLAPFLVGEGSGIGNAHPDWLLQDEEGRPLAVETRVSGSGPVFALDASRRDVQDYLRAMTRFAVTEWGYDVLQLDALGAGARGTRGDRRASPWEALRAGLRALREGAPRALLLARDVPLQHADGLFDVVEIGAERTETRWTDLAASAANVARHGFLARRNWLMDPGDLIAANDLTLDEVRAWAAWVTLSGGTVTLPAPIAALDPDRLALLQRCVPVAALRPVFSDAMHRGQEPPSALIARSGTDTWMVAAFNWSDDPKRLTLDLAGAGAAGTFAAYDVWADERRTSVAGRVGLDVASHSSRLLALRRPRAFPFVLGTTRHLVQHAVDVGDEHWDARRRVLSGHALALDGRPYAVTIAVPAGFHPRGCESDVDCEVEHAHARASAVRLTFAKTPRDVEWEVRF